MRAIIEYIGERGSVQARLRKLEVEQLADQLSNAAAAATFQPAPKESQPDGSSIPQFHRPTAEVQEGGYRDDPMFGSPFFDEWNFDTGLSADQIMNLVEALDDDFAYF